MRKFFIVLSILVLIVLISSGIHNKVKSSQDVTREGEQVSAVYHINSIRC